MEGEGERFNVSGSITTREVRNEEIRQVLRPKLLSVFLFIEYFHTFATQSK